MVQIVSQYVEKHICIYIFIYIYDWYISIHQFLSLCQCNSLQYYGGEIIENISTFNYLIKSFPLWSILLELGSPFCVYSEKQKYSILLEEN